MLCFSGKSSTMQPPAKSTTLLRLKHLRDLQSNATCALDAVVNSNAHGVSFRETVLEDALLSLASRGPS